MLNDIDLDTLYGNIYQSLETMTAVIKFIKKDGSTRVMLCTRNKETSRSLCNGNDYGAKLGGFDKRTNINNHNIAVIDLVLCDVRTFCVERLEGYQFLGVITNENSSLAFDYYELVMKQVEEEKEKVLKENQSLIDIV